MNEDVFKTDMWAAGLKQRVVNRTTRLRLVEAEMKVARAELLEADHELTDYLIALSGGGKP